MILIVLRKYCSLFYEIEDFYYLIWNFVLKCGSAMVTEQENHQRNIGRFMKYSK